MNQLIRSLTAAVVIAISFSLFSCDDNEESFGLTGTIYFLLFASLLVRYECFTYWQI